MKRNIFDTVLRDVSFDSRITNGIFDIEKNDHMDILREYFTNKGIDSDTVREFTNGVLEGKYPERQAYNVKGILVTFPTPEYKANALKAGTHFENDPTKRAPNVFAAAQQDKAAERSAPAATPDEPAAAAPKPAPTTLPTSAAGPEPTPADTKTPGQSPGKTPEQPPEVPPPQTTQAPQPSPETSEPEPEPTQLPEPEIKSEPEKTADKNVIKTILKGDDYMLEAEGQFPVKMKMIRMHVLEIINELNKNPDQPLKNILRSLKELSNLLDSIS